MAAVNYDIPFFTTLLQQALTRPIKIIQVMPVGGGDSHHSFQITLANQSRFFIKCNHASDANVFEQERYALAALQQADTIKVPAIFGTGVCQGRSYLVLEWLALSAAGNEATLGLQLAQMHQHCSDRFGWEADNFIGHSLQKNTWCTNWASFWRDQRLLPQLMMALERRTGRSLSAYADDFLAASDALLADHTPKPALLHGDLWGGNKAYLASGEPVIFDPASYYGDPEVDVAFTHLFGGFGPDFYTAYYHAQSKLQKGPALPVFSEAVLQRQVLYNSYHQLNHFNLFGESYLSECKQAMQRVIGFSR